MKKLHFEMPELNYPVITLGVCRWGRGEEWGGAEECWGGEETHANLTSFFFFLGERGGG